MSELGIRAISRRQKEDEAFRAVLTGSDSAEMLLAVEGYDITLTELKVLQILLRRPDEWKFEEFRRPRTDVKSAY